MDSFLGLCRRHSELPMALACHAYGIDICHCEERFLQCHSGGQAISTNVISRRALVCQSDAHTDVVYGDVG